MKTLKKSDSALSAHLEGKLSFRFFKDILLYSGGSFAGRIATLFLLPLTTSYLTPGDYGIIGVLTLLPIFMNSLFSLGFHTSLGRVYATGKDRSEKEGIIWTAFLALILNNLLLTAAAFIFAKPITIFLLESANQSSLIKVTFAGIGICSVRMCFEYHLRASNQSAIVFVLNLADAFFSISVMLYEVVFLRKGAAGYMEAFAIAQSLNLAIILLFVAPKLQFSIQWEKLKDLLKIGLPCIYGYWGYCILQGASRYLLPHYSTEEEAGLYFLGSNLGRIIELPLWGFMSAWVPFFNSYIERREEAPQAFSKIMSYYLLGMSFLLAPLFCFAKGVVQVFVQPAFHEAWKVVGLSGMAQALWGAYAITYPPLIFSKKTGIQACLELSAAAVCVLANIYLIPLFQGEGAALATFIGFAALIFMSVCYNNKLMKIHYENLKILKLAAGLGFCAIVSFFPFMTSFSYFLSMGASLLLFYCFICFFILTPYERNAALQFFRNKFKREEVLQ